MFWRGPEWLSAAGAQGSGNLVKQRFGKQSCGFTWVLGTFARSWWVQARKELTLSVLEDVSRGLSTSGHPTRRLEVLKAPRRIYRLPPLPPTPSTWILAGWLAGWLTGWLTGWLAVWLAGLAGWLAGLAFHGFSLILIVFCASGVIVL